MFRGNVRRGKQLTIEAEENRRVFDRIPVEGVATIDEENFRIRDVSVGGFSAFGRFPDLSEGDIKRITFRIKHGDLEVSGSANFECLSNGYHGPLRFKILNASESITEFFRAATLRSTSGAEYATAWISEEVESLAVNSKRTRTRGTGVLPSVLATAVFLALMLYVGQSSTAKAVWVTHRHALEAPVTGTLTRDGRPIVDIHPDKTIASFAAQTVGGTEFEVPMSAEISAHSIDWLFNSGDLVQQGDVIAHATNFPLEVGARLAAVSIDIPFVQPGIGDTVILRTGTGQIIEAKIARFSARADMLASEDERFDRDLGDHVLIARVETDQPADISTLHVAMMRTVGRFIHSRWAGR